VRVPEVVAPATKFVPPSEQLEEEDEFEAEEDLAPELLEEVAQAGFGEALVMEALYQGAKQVLKEVDVVEDVLLPADVAINEVMGGSEGETISARVGRRENAPQTVVADVLDRVDPGHTQRALSNVPTNQLPCVPDWLQRRIAREMKRGRIPCVLKRFLGGV
jgi:hypothetical protein